MLNNRINQKIYLSFFIGISFIGVLASFGLFDFNWRWDFYIHFTNISNYLCIIFSIFELRYILINKETENTNYNTLLKFVLLLSIFLTFIIFNFLLAPNRSIKSYFKINSMTFHLFIPILFILDWFLFYKHKTIKWYYPILAIILPIAYVIFIFIHAYILNFNTNIMNFDNTEPFIYPYFFLRLDLIGIGGVFKWILIITISFVVVGYIFYFIDKLLK